MNAHLKNGRSYCTSNRVWHFVVVLFLPISGISVRFLLNVNVNANAFTYTHHNMIIDEMQYYMYTHICTAWYDIHYCCIHLCTHKILYDAFQRKHPLQVQHTRLMSSPFGRGVSFLDTATTRTFLKTPHNKPGFVCWSVVYFPSIRTYQVKKSYLKFAFFI